MSLRDRRRAGSEELVITRPGQGRPSSNEQSTERRRYGQPEALVGVTIGRSHAVRGNDRRLDLCRLTIFSVLFRTRVLVAAHGVVVQAGQASGR
jgi:hypothetical protein